MDGAALQPEAMSMMPLGEGETARFFAASRFDGIDCLTATFRTHVYPPHTHDTYVVGTIETGRDVWSARGTKGYAGPGDIIFIMPQEVHDGAPVDGGYSYRMSYPGEDFIRMVAEAVSGRPVCGPPLFRTPMVHDSEGARLFSLAHRAIEAAADGLAGEELLLRAYARCLVLHADIPEAVLGREEGPIGRVRAMIEERFAEDLRLDELAAAAGFSSHHLIRAFRRQVGLTPHAYVIDVRVRRAQDRLRLGTAPAEVAADVGFADQAHLTRAFKARLGVTPGAYRRAVA